ncbi:MAG TPA: hypothetical protein VE172_12375 [Stackebrandtia sp.]|jgi:hypothetical protein|uniref:hypothetical protein n=1 Tax=Stackebrandtia sp. TaxID=2023065 RepID=UPI002D69AC62|nr:hypothetical protein [Stackebrandtia sp.]HZE39597.1 hypothetical protein [Stackebrandtia sp.]
MRTFAEIMAAHEEEVSSPDGNIKARLKSGDVADFEFRPGTYERYTDVELASQLEGISRLIAVARRRARRRALRESLELDFEPEPATPDSPASRRVFERQDAEVVVVETSSVRVRVRGTRTWQVKIRPGTTRNMTEEMFKKDVALAAKRTLTRARSAMQTITELETGPSFILQGLTGLNLTK